MRAAIIIGVLGLCVGLVAYSVQAQDGGMDGLLQDLDGGLLADDEKKADDAEQVPAADVNADAEAPTDADDADADAEPAAEEEAPAVQPAAAETLLNLLDTPTPAEPTVVEPVAPPPTERPSTRSRLQPTPPTAEDARRYAQQEEIRREADEQRAQRSLDAARQALKIRDYETAAKSFEEVLLTMPERPQNEASLTEAREGATESYYRQAVAIPLKKANADRIRQAADKALKYTPGFVPAEKLLARLERVEKYVAPPPPPSRAADIVVRDKAVADFLRQGKQFYELGDYDRAEGFFEKALLTDPYQVDAMRFLRKIEEDRYRISSKERDTTVANMIRQVRESWTPPLRVKEGLPGVGEVQPTIQTTTASEALRRKMERLIIPVIDFRAANIHDVINFLVDASQKQDPDRVGVNIILNLSQAGGGGTPATPGVDRSLMDMDLGLMDMPMVDQPEVEPTAPPVGTISLNLRRISLLDALKYITEVAELKYRIEENAVIVTPLAVETGRMLTRMYPVQPSFMDVVFERIESDTTRRQSDIITMERSQVTEVRQDVKQFFSNAGVPFPPGASIVYQRGISTLIIKNTPENLELFERILAQLNVVPQLVEIEARFVEVTQTDLQELGIEWLLTDNWQIAQKKGPAPLGGQERIQVNKNSHMGGFTRGLRWMDITGSGGVGLIARSDMAENMLGNIFSISSILTNPEMTVVVNALSQKGHADLLSAPKVTCRSGVNAQIQVVREIIYPTEFEVSQPTIIEGGIATPPTVTPGSFETREVGVLLNVTPTVAQDGYTIDLVMQPEVSELADWIQYGSSITMANGAVYTYNIPQPVFASRNVSTTIVIWDGETVVMGGLIGETVLKVVDKIPFLGDIPLLGRLFRSEGQRSEKRNLIIFVTARLVDPAGNVIKKKQPADALAPVESAEQAGM